MLTIRFFCESSAMLFYLTEEILLRRHTSRGKGCQWPIHSHLLVKRPSFPSASQMTCKCVYIPYMKFPLLSYIL